MTDYGNTVQRAKLLARFLERAGRSDIPVGIGIEENDDAGRQAAWVKGYDLTKYPGKVREDGVQALIDTIMKSPEPVTLISIGPLPNIAAALEREPRIAGARGSSACTAASARLRRQADARSRVERQGQRHSRPAALAAPWQEPSTPLDTCGLVRLSGSATRASAARAIPCCAGLVEAYGSGVAIGTGARRTRSTSATKSSTLFDTVAVYLAISRDLVETETTGVRVTDEGMTVADPAARPLVWATEWRDLAGFEEWLTARLTGRPTAR